MNGKNMKKRKLSLITILTVLILLTAGCSKDATPQSIVGRNTGMPINLEMTVLTAEEDSTHAPSQTRTRAVDGNVWTSFASGDAVAAYIVDNSGKEAAPGTNSGWTNYTFDGTTWTPSPMAYYPDDYDHIDITCAYPVKNNTTETVAGGAAISGCTSFTVLADQTTEASYKASDLLTFHLPDIAPAASIPVVMSHKMARIRVKVASASGVTIRGIKVNGFCLSSGTFTPTTGELSDASGTAEDITIFDGDVTADSYYCCLVPPQTHRVGTLVTLITGDYETITFSLASDKAFESGEDYRLDLNVNNAMIGHTYQIAGWASRNYLTMYPEKEVVVLRNRPEALEAVDLGITVNGVKVLWANMNVGATAVNDRGQYFAWGETIGYGDYTGDGRSFNWASYDLGPSSNNPWMYNSTDGLTTLRMSDDAARVNWGAPWRMPTIEELKALRSTYSSDGSLGWEWTWYDSTNSDPRYSGMAGLEIKNTNTSSEAYGNSIFLPYTGYRYDDQLYFVGERLYYWSSSLYKEGAGKDNAYCLHIGYGLSNVDNFYRYYGNSVRPVQEQR